MSSVKSPTPSELLVKQTANIDNIRQSPADNGMWFDATDRLEGCPEFKENVFQIFRKDRPSRMNEDSRYRDI